MIIAALDVGSHLALAVSGHEPIHFHCPGERPERLAAGMAWLDDQFKGFVDRDEGVDLIIYERPFARGQHATRSLWGIAGIIDAMAHKHGFPVIDIDPSSIKLWAAGKGNADKDDMIAAAFLLGYHTDNEHKADAHCLLKFAEAHVQNDLFTPPEKPKRSKKK